MAVEFLKFFFLRIYKRTSCFVFIHFHVLSLLSTDKVLFKIVSFLTLSSFCKYFIHFSFFVFLQTLPSDSLQAPKTSSSSLPKSTPYLSLSLSSALQIYAYEISSHQAWNLRVVLGLFSLLIHSSKSSQFDFLKISKLLSFLNISLELSLSLSHELSW